MREGLGDDWVSEPENTTFRYFGPLRPSHLSARCKIPTPLDRQCTWCEQAFVEGDQGITLPYLSESGTTDFTPYHHQCFIRTILGPDLAEIPPKYADESGE